MQSKRAESRQDFVESGVETWIADQINRSDFRMGPIPSWAEIVAESAENSPISGENSPVEKPSRGVGGVVLALSLCVAVELLLIAWHVF